MRRALSLPGGGTRGVPLLFAASLAAPPALLSVDPAAAQAPLEGAQHQAAPAPSGARTHDGFYLRVSSGFAVYDERLRSGQLPTEGRVTGRSRGIATVSDLALGGTVARGWVVGGAISSLDLVASTYRATPDKGTPPEALDPGLRNLAIFGAFVDYYPNTAGGLHLQATLGLALLTPRVFGHAATEQSEYAAVGGALLLGTGYEWWVADEWSLGVLSQLGVRVLRGREAGVRWTHIATDSPSLSVTVTYH